MSSLEEIRNERIKKLETLKKGGINPYPVSVSRDFPISEVQENFSKFLKEKKQLSLVGRIMSIRGHGGSVFFDINDGSTSSPQAGSFDKARDKSTSLTTGGKTSIQCYLKKDEVGDEAFSLFQDTIDIGDFIEVKGEVFVTKKEENSLLVSEWKIISKSLRPLPDKWHGLQDVEERFRKRYLDLLMNEGIKERFILRSKIISEIRDFLNKEDYLEVETPVLQPLAGGATAAPFTTHHNALDIDLYLRVAPELYLKELLVGGFTKVYEIGRSFRNEGISVAHNPEFTMLEFYEAYSDGQKQRDFVEKLFRTLVKNIFSKTSIEHGGQKIDFSKKFEVVSYGDLFKKYADIDSYESLSREDLITKAKEHNVAFDDSDAKDKIADNIYKKIIRPKLIQPTFIIDYPIEFSPFAKKHFDRPELIDRFQLIVNGMELVNAFSELNDPIDQKERYLEQDKKRKAGEAEVSPSDEGYLEAMEYGMPPAGGVGVGIDRLVMLLTDTHNIKEVILFPTMRPKS